jgi:hypothetical protein
MTSKNEDDWKVLPHGPIEKLSENLWCVHGSLKGMSLNRASRRRPEAAAALRKAATFLR